MNCSENEMHNFEYVQYQDIEAEKNVKNKLNDKIVDEKLKTLISPKTVVTFSKRKRAHNWRKI
jgi:hypothetical protein